MRETALTAMLDDPSPLVRPCLGRHPRRFARGAAPSRSSRLANDQGAVASRGAGPLAGSHGRRSDRLRRPRRRAGPDGDRTPALRVGGDRGGPRRDRGTGRARRCWPAIPAPRSTDEPVAHGRAAWVRSPLRPGPAAAAEVCRSTCATRSRWRCRTSCRRPSARPAGSPPARPSAPSATRATRRRSPWPRRATGGCAAARRLPPPHAANSPRP